MSNYVFANSTLQPGQPAINTTVQAVTPSGEFSMNLRAAFARTAAHVLGILSGPFVATTVTVDATAVISANYTRALLGCGTGSGKAASRY